MSRGLGLVSIGLAVGVLGAGYGLGGRWAGIPIFAALGFVWLFGYWRDWGWVASVGLTGLVAAAAVGLWLELSAGWMVAGLVVGLCAWDLHRFVSCLRRAERVKAEQRLEQQHLQRLLIVTSLGLLAAALALRIEINLSFLLALLLGLLAVWGLSRAVGLLRRESG